MYDIIFDVLSAWQVIAVGLLIMIVLPVVFYFASFDKKPVKIKRIPDKKKSAPVKSVRKKAINKEDNQDKSANRTEAGDEPVDDEE